MELLVVQEKHYLFNILHYNLVLKGRLMFGLFIDYMPKCYIDDAKRR